MLPAERGGGAEQPQRLGDTAGEAQQRKVLEGREDAREMTDPLSECERLVVRGFRSDQLALGDRKLAEPLMRVGAQTGKQVGVGFKKMFAPANRKAREIIQSIRLTQAFPIPTQS